MEHEKPIRVLKDEKRPSRLKWVLLIIILGFALTCSALALLPVEADEKIDEADWGVGAVNIEPAWTGLLRPWPENGQEVDPRVANLGYLLFFDPILSGENNYSCAHCHHPDLGFSDGKTLAINGSGDTLNRHTPTLWNVAFNTSFFWDGRANSLETQLAESLTSSDEMNQDLNALVIELQGVEAYVTAFEAMFEDGITIDNITLAITSFERTLVSDGSAFDAYAEGDLNALTPQQRRGLGLFRSAATRCFECHSVPTFATTDFLITGVPDNGSNDKGRGSVENSDGLNYAFKSPTLRNAVLSMPYMHNGYANTLEDVIAFYSDGGDLDEANIDRFVAAGFNLSEQETEDLIAFLYSLTDESIPETYWDQANYIDENGKIVIPESVPSGLTEIVEPVQNPARKIVEERTAPPASRPECERDAEAKTVTVREGQTIQAAVDCALAGDTILVPPGIYHERVLIDTNEISLRGLIDNEPDMCPIQTPEALWPSGDDAPRWPILDGDIDNDGKKDLTDGVIASGHNFTMEFFMIRNYTGNGVLVEGVHDVTLRHLYAEDTGLYGFYPVRSTNVLVECTVVTLTTDAGVYVGQSQDIVVRNNLAYDNVTGIEIENSVNADVYQNETWNNTGGILVFLLPNLHSRVSRDIRVYENYVHDNNRPKEDATPGSIVGKIPIGSGIFVMATDHSEIYNNRIVGNNSFGIGIVSLYQAYEEDEIGDVGPLSENNHVHDNQFENNGNNPDPAVEDAGLPGADLLWDARGYGNVWDEEDASRFPPVLPGPNWINPAERVYFQIVNFIGKRF